MTFSSCHTINIQWQCKWRKEMYVALQPSDCNKNITYMNEWLCNEEQASEQASEREQQWKCEKKSHKNIISSHEKHIYVRGRRRRHHGSDQIEEWN